jgi:hypothetical protein
VVICALDVFTPRSPKSIRSWKAGFARLGELVHLNDPAYPDIHRREVIKGDLRHGII